MKLNSRITKKYGNPPLSMRAENVLWQLRYVTGRKSFKAIAKLARDGKIGPNKQGTCSKNYVRGYGIAVHKEIVNAFVN